MTVILKYLLFNCINSISFFNSLHLNFAVMRVTPPTGHLHQVVCFCFPCEIKSFNHRAADKKIVSQLLRTHSVQNMFQVKNCHKNILYLYYFQLSVSYIFSSVNNDEY